MSKKEDIFEFTLDKTVYSNDTFCIARVFSKSDIVSKYLNPIWFNVSIKGNMPKLKHSIVYLATLKNVEENKYGFTLNVDNVYPRDFVSENINTDVDMVNFIEVFIGEGTANKFRDVKGICDMVKNKDYDSLMNVNGIGKATAKKIIEKYEKDIVGSKFMVKLKKLGFTDNEIKNLKDTYGENLLVSYDKVKQNIFDLVFMGFRLDRMDKIFLEGLKGKATDKRRIKAYIWRGLKDWMLDGYKSYIPIENFYKLNVIENIYSNVGKDLLEKCIEELVSDKKLKIINEKIITTTEQWFQEKRLVEILNELINNQNIPMLPIDDIDKEIDEQEEIIGFKLNEGQRVAVKSIVLSNNAINMLNGYAGTRQNNSYKSYIEYI